MFFLLSDNVMAIVDVFTLFDAEMAVVEVVTDWVGVSATENCSLVSYDCSSVVFDCLSILFDCFRALANRSSDLANLLFNPFKSFIVDNVFSSLTGVCFLAVNDRSPNVNIPSPGLNHCSLDVGFASSDLGAGNVANVDNRTSLDLAVKSAGVDVGKAEEEVEEEEEDEEEDKNGIDVVGVRWRLNK